MHDDAIWFYDACIHSSPVQHPASGSGFGLTKNTPISCGTILGTRQSSQPAETILAHVPIAFPCSFKWQCCALFGTDRLLLLVDGFLLEMAPATCSSRPGFTWVWQRSGETLEREVDRLNLLRKASIEACFCSSSTGVWLSYIFFLGDLEVHGANTVVNVESCFIVW